MPSFRSRIRTSNLHKWDGGICVVSSSVILESCPDGKSASREPRRERIRLKCPVTTGGKLVNLTTESKKKCRIGFSHVPWQTGSRPTGLRSLASRGPADSPRVARSIFSEIVAIILSVLIFLCIKVILLLRGRHHSF